MSNLDLMRKALSQMFLSEEYHLWLKALGPYSDVCDELGLIHETWLARNVIDVKPQYGISQKEIVIVLKIKFLLKDIYLNPAILGGWLGLKEGSVYISSSFPGDLRVGIKRDDKQSLYKFVEFKIKFKVDLTKEIDKNINYE